MNHVFRSKLGLEIALPIAGILLAETTLMVVGGTWPGVMVVAGVMSFISYLYVETKYIITLDDQLHIRCGFLINETVSIPQITRVAATRTWLSAPAFSLDRLEIFTGENAVAVISPADKSKFVHALLLRNPAIQVHL